MNITVDYKYDNWHIIKKRLRLEKLPTITFIPSSDEAISVPSPLLQTRVENLIYSIRSGARKPTLSSSIISIKPDKSTLGTPFSVDDKINILKRYNRLENLHMWFLPSDEWFTKQELQEINVTTERQKKHLPQKMKNYLDALPESENINVLFNYLNEQQINPSDHRGLYFLKTTLLYSLDLFRTSYLPVTDQGERDIMRRIWVIIDWVFDGSNLKVRSEKGSFASKSDKSKKRKIAAITSMTKQRPSDVPDLLIYYDRYEFCSVEAGKMESSDTKQKNDSSKLAVNCKQMLLNLSQHAPSLQQEISITGISIRGMKLTIHELSNPKGVVCVNKKTDELYFPVHIIEWRNKMVDLCEKLWILRMEMEERFRAVCTSSGRSASCTLTPCFQKTK
ncbi:hypothetical protein BY458DRAFT_571107 [Sporodiniella umbellata]|nr:hypothetical protein BY458DRAFT_571107 [Sporodiniella umbellata]